MYTYASYAYEPGHLSDLLPSYLPETALYFLRLRRLADDAL